MSSNKAPFTFVDLFAGIVTVSCGHCHPKVLRRIQEQAATLQHATTIYLHPNLPLLAEKLASKMPEGLDVTYFVNSGSEANDLAVTMVVVAELSELFPRHEEGWLSMRDPFFGLGQFKRRGAVKAA